VRTPSSSLAACASAWIFSSCGAFAARTLMPVSGRFALTPWRPGHQAGVGAARAARGDEVVEGHAQLERLAMSSSAQAT
jgi:hypothetical protein